MCLVEDQFRGFPTSSQLDGVPQTVVDTTGTDPDNALAAAALEPILNEPVDNLKKITR